MAKIHRTFSFTMLFILLFTLHVVLSIGTGPLTNEENVRLQQTCGVTAASNKKKTAAESMNTIRGNRFDAPFTVLIHTSYFNTTISKRLNGTGMCTGTLISPRHVLTAAHCLFTDRVTECNGDVAKHFIPTFNSGNATMKLKLDYYLISAPTECTNICDTQLKTKIATPRRAFIAKEWINDVCNPRQVSGDVAIIELDQDVELSLTVKPACIYNKQPPDNSTITIYGYGITHFHLQDTGSIMRKHETKLYPTELCRKMTIPKYNFEEPSQNKTITYPVSSDEFCSRHEKALACMGDSGSGQILQVDKRSYVVGILSWGPKCIPELMNLPEDAVDFSVSLYYHKEWICAATGVCPSGQSGKEEEKQHSFYTYELSGNFDQEIVKISGDV